MVNNPGYVITRWAHSPLHSFSFSEININLEFLFVLLFYSYLHTFSKLTPSFCFLLWGLSAVASSVNLLVLKFMTISLEEVGSRSQEKVTGRRKEDAGKKNWRQEAGVIHINKNQCKEQRG